MVFMHQNRPLLAPRNVTLIHDTIQISNTRGMTDLTLKLGFLRKIVATSAHVLTVSAWSRRQIVELLGASPDRITVIPNPVDDRVATRIRQMREARPDREPIALYVGRFAEHKNLPRLIRAYRGSRFATDGGRLVLLGGSAAECADLRAAAPDMRGVELIPTCPQDELERWYARAAFLVQPSLLEGFGLPVAEALAAGIPVCSSDGGALPEVTAGLARLFDPTALDAIRDALDATADTAAGREAAAERDAAARYLAAVRTPTTYAIDFEDLVVRFGRRPAEAGPSPLPTPAPSPGWSP
jgi:glycosyltransferase involved in cell wall biosynthesis